MLNDESTEVFDVFVSWLYDRTRALKVPEGFDLVKFVKTYLFAVTYHISGFKRTVVKNLLVLLTTEEVEVDVLFSTVEQIFAKSVKQNRYEISRPFYTISDDLLACEDIGSSNLLSLYAFAVRRSSNRLKNLAMDMLQDTLMKTSELLTPDQVEWVFENIDHPIHSPNEPKQPNERMRRFCVALIHFQRFSDDEKVAKLSPQDALNYYFCACDDFIRDYLDFEQEVMLSKISDVFEAGDDPRERTRGSFPSCYFHVHEENEQCHGSDQRVAFAS